MTVKLLTVTKYEGKWLRLEQHRIYLKRKAGDISIYSCRKEATFTLTPAHLLTSLSWSSSERRGLDFKVFLQRSKRWIREKRNTVKIARKRIIIIYTHVHYMYESSEEEDTPAVMYNQFCKCILRVMLLVWKIITSCESLCVISFLTCLNNRGLMYYNFKLKW